MKRFTTPVLPVRVGLDDLSSAARIDFIFKQYDSAEACALVEKSWPENATLSGEVIYIPFSEAETAFFEGDRPFYMDTRIVLSDGTVPQTNKNVLFMNSTLFSEARNE